VGGETAREMLFSFPLVVMIHAESCFSLTLLLRCERERGRDWWKKRKPKARVYNCISESFKCNVDKWWTHLV
jgi:hypothetical protein